MRGAGPRRDARAQQHAALLRGAGRVRQQSVRTLCKAHNRTKIDLLYWNSTSHTATKSLIPQTKPQHLTSRTPTEYGDLTAIAGAVIAEGAAAPLEAVVRHPIGAGLDSVDAARAAPTTE